jgi:hypothetical protein
MSGTTLPINQAINQAFSRLFPQQSSWNSLGKQEPDYPPVYATDKKYLHGRRHRAAMLRIGEAAIQCHKLSMATCGPWMAGASPRLSGLILWTGSMALILL